MPPPRTKSAFTLIELLAVMVIIVIIIGVTVPVVTALKSSADVSKAVYDIAGLFAQARAYAMGSNTYVYVGLEEVNAAQVGTTQNPGNGRVVLAVVATKDGTEGFSASSLQNWTTAYPAFAADLMVVGKPMIFDNIHVPDLGQPPASGGMVRPALSTSTGMSYSVGNTNCVSGTPFDYPVGSGLGGGQYSFTKVIQIDPQGVARIQSASNPSGIPTYVEIGLQQSHGASVQALPSMPTSGNIAALQIDGMTGSVRIYRP